MDAKSNSAGGIIANASSGAEAIELLAKYFLGGGCNLKPHERRRMATLAYLLAAGDEWLARKATYVSKRTVGRLKLDYQRRGLNCIFHDRADRTPPEFMAAKDQIRAAIMGYLPRQNASAWEQQFRAAGIPCPGQRSLRAWVRQFRALRRFQRLHSNHCPA